MSASSSMNIQRLRGRAVSNRSHPDDSADPRPDQNSLEHARVVLEIRSLSMRFENTVVLNSIQLTLHEGQTLVVLGASGCGKTTLLKIIAGLLNGYTGSVQLTTTRPPGNSTRNTSVLYLDQEPLLFEHLNVAENIAFAMRMQRCAGDEIERDVNELLRSIELSEHRSRMSRQLSGGQKQRVAFARAVLARPHLLLLDEPFGSLDAQSRTQMQQLFAKLKRQYGITTIFVTHDVREALVVGDVFARMEHGRLQIYPDRSSFVSDPDTGIPGEIEFWKNAEKL